MKEMQAMSILACKPCSVCKKVKHISEFYKRSDKPNLIRSSCKKCSYDNPRSSETRRAYKLKTLYQIDKREYESMFAAQGGVCAICGQAEDGMANNGNRRRHLSVDHDHENGKVRELLCGKCNVLLGKIGENVGFLQRMIDYLKKHEKATSQR